MLAGTGRRYTSAASFRRSLGRFAIAQAIQRARSWPRIRLKSGERRLTQSDAAIAFRRAAGLMDRRRSGRPRLIAIILGESIDFAGDLRAVFAVCMTPQAARGDDHRILRDQAFHDPIPRLAVVEHPELVAERLLRYADIVGRDSVMASTDCGFSQSPPPAACTVRSCGRS